MRYRILVVDDQKRELEATQLFLKRILREEGIEGEIVSALTAPETKKAIEEYGRSLDLILLDLNMPGESGAELYAEIKDQCNEFQIPVRIYTGVFDGTNVTDTTKIKLVGDIKEYLAYDIMNKRNKDENTKVILGTLYFRDGQTHMRPEERQEYWELCKKYEATKALPDLSQVKDAAMLRYLELRAKWHGQQEVANSAKQKREAAA